MKVASITLLTLLASLDSALSDSVSSRLAFHRPAELKKDDGYEHREALFGIPPYGGSLTQQVYWADSELCEPVTDKTMGYPVTRDSEGKIEEWKSPFILMVDRGNCTFVTKVRNAQRAGAAGVLIADNICQCTDDECNAAHGNAACEPKEPIMADDGSGGDVSIPSFLMAKHDADKVKKVLKDNSFVQVEMSWNLPSDGEVKYDIWTTPADPVSVEFFQNFKPFAAALKGKAKFTPHAYIINGVAVNCNTESGDNYCYTLCTNNGRYCALDPDSNVDAGVSGSDVVQESLRRLCIWEAYGGDGIGRPYWDYVSTFNDRCRNEDYFKDPACLRDAYKVGKIDEKKIDDCMAKAGDPKADRVVEKFEDEIALQEQRGIIVVPTAFVNSVAIRGSLTAESMFSAICAGFGDGNTPPICTKCASCSDQLGCVQNGVCANGGSSRGSGSSDSVSTHTFAFSILFIMILAGAVIVWHYKKTQEEMREQVRGIMAEYMPLDDQEGMANGTSPMDFARGATTTSLIS